MFLSDVPRGERLRALGVGEEVRVIPGALPKAVVVVHVRPLLAAILGAVEAALLGFDQRRDAVGVGPGHRCTDATQMALRQSVPLLPNGQQ